MCIRDSTCAPFTIRGSRAAFRYSKAESRLAASAAASSRRRRRSTSFPTCEPAPARWSATVAAGPGPRCSPVTGGRRRRLPPAAGSWPLGVDSAAAPPSAPALCGVVRPRSRYVARRSTRRRCCPQIGCYRSAALPGNKSTAPRSLKHENTSSRADSPLIPIGYSLRRINPRSPCTSTGLGIYRKVQPSSIGVYGLFASITPFLARYLRSRYVRIYV